MNPAAVLTIMVKANGVNETTRELGHLDKAGARASGTLSKAAKTGFAAVAAGAGVAAAGVAAFAKVSVDAASDVSESISKNRVLFGDYAKDIEAFSKTSASALGISRRAALEYTGVFGNLSRAIGISKKDSADMSVQLTKLAADLASFNNTGIEEALDALRSGLTGETEPLRRFGVTLSEVSVKAEAVRSGIVKLSVDSTKVKTAALGIESSQKAAAAALKEHGRASTEYRTAANATEVAQNRFKAAAKGTVPDLTAQQKALATVSQVMRQTKTAQGDAERTAGAYAGQVKRLNARIDDLKVSLGEKLLPVFTRAVTKVNNLVAAFSDGGDKAKSFSSATDGLAKSFQGHSRAMSKVLEALKPYIELTQDAVAWTRRHKTAMDLLSAAIITPTENLEHIATALNAISSAARGVVTAMKQVAKSFGNTMAGPLGSLLGKAAGAIRNTGDGIGSIGRSITAFGGGLKGARPSMAPVAGMASRFGLGVSSGLRRGAITSSGNKSYHSTGEALDLAGSPAGMKGFFNFMKNTMGGSLAELIYTPGGAGIRNGASHTYTGKVAADHFDHVHVAIDSGVPGVGDGIGQIQNLWTKAGGSANMANMAAAIAMAESGGRPSASNRNSDGSIDRGLWQINSVHGALSTFDRMGNARAAVRISRNGRNWNPWTVYKSGAYKRFLSGKGGKGGKGSGSREAPRGAQSDYAPETMYGPSPGPYGGLISTVNGITYVDGLPVLNTNQPGPGKGPGGGPTKGIPEGYEPPVLPSLADFATAAVARARLTPELGDDLAALQALQAVRKGELDAALADADPRNDEEAINAFLSVKDAIDQLTGEMEKANQRLALEQQIADNQLKIIAIAAQGDQIVNAVIAAVSGGIGGQLGLGFQTPGYAGGVANYSGGGTGRL